MPHIIFLVETDLVAPPFDPWLDLSGRLVSAGDVEGASRLLKAILASYRRRNEPAEIARVTERVLASARAKSPKNAEQFAGMLRE